MPAAVSAWNRSASRFPKRPPPSKLLSTIDDLNANPRVRGILLQHPVPHQIDERACFDRIAIEKDVDGVTSHGFGRMAMGEPPMDQPRPPALCGCSSATASTRPGRKR